jgi:hypothetical protein
LLVAGLVLVAFAVQRPVVLGYDEQRLTHAGTPPYAGIA